MRELWVVIGREICLIVTLGVVVRESDEGGRDGSLTRPLGGAKTLKFE